MRFGIAGEGGRELQKNGKFTFFMHDKKDKAASAPSIAAVAL